MTKGQMMSVTEWWWWEWQVVVYVLINNNESIFGVLGGFIGGFLNGHGKDWGVGMWEKLFEWLLKYWDA